MKEDTTPLQIAKNWLKLLVLLGIAPWAYFYVSYLAPSVHQFLGFENVRAIFYLIPIIALPAFLFKLLLDKHDHVDPQGNSQKNKTE